MKFRWTIKELQGNTDKEVLRKLVIERMSTLNSYAPLYQRLEQLRINLNVQIKNERGGINQ